MSERRHTRRLKSRFRRHFKEFQPPPGGWELFDEILEACASVDKRGRQAQPRVDVRGLVHLRQAMEILLTHHLKPHEALKKQRQLRQLFAHLRRLNDLHPEWGLAALPQLSRNRVGYFLWQAARGQPPAAWALLNPCLEALRQAEREWPVRPEVERGALERLPFELAQFIRTFPPARCVGRRLIGPPSVSDIRAAFARRRASPRGLQSAKTEAEYVTAVARALGLTSPPAPSGLTVSISGWPGLRSLRDLGLIEGEGDIHAELLGELDGSLRGLLAYPAEAPPDSAHPLEEAVWISPEGPWRSWTKTVPRADQYRQIWDGKGFSVNEVARLGLDLARPDLSRPDARFEFLVGGLTFTGLLAKRLLNAHIFLGPGEEMEAWLEAKEAAVMADPADFVVIGPHARVVWAKIPQDPRYPEGPYSPASLRIIRLPLPPPLWRLAKIGWAHTLPSCPPGPLAFQTRSGRPIDIAELGGPLQALGRRIAPLDPALRLSRLRHTLRPYAAAAGLSSVIAALLSGSPTLQEQVLLHYIRYPASTYWDRSARAQMGPFKAAREVLQEGTLAWECEPDPPPVWLPSGHYGCRFGVDDAAIRQAWRATHAALKTARSLARRLNLTTLLITTMLIAGAGLRELELPAIRRGLVDLQAGLLRLRGKGSRYFLEAREVPLNSLIISALARYLRLLDRLRLAGANDPLFWVDLGDGLAPLKVGDLDRVIAQEGLDWAWPFRPAWLRHWLRTGLELAGVDEVAVNEAYGHATSVMTALHPLSSADLPRLQEVFRAATTVILKGVVEEGW